MCCKWKNGAIECFGVGLVYSVNCYVGIVIYSRKRDVMSVMFSPLGGSNGLYKIRCIC